MCPIHEAKTKDQFHFCLHYPKFLKLGLNTGLAIVDFIKYILNSFEEGNYTISTFSNLSKAFDCIGIGSLIGSVFSCRCLLSYSNPQAKTYPINEPMLVQHEFTDSQAIITHHQHKNNASCLLCDL